MKKTTTYQKIIFFTFSFILSTFFLLAQDTSVNVKNEIFVDSVVSLNEMANEEPNTNKKTIIGRASYYAKKFEGRKTANGEIFSHKKFTAACNVLPLGTWVEVTNLRNNKKVIVKTNDRLHPKMKRVVDLTMAAAVQLDFVKAGLTNVKVVVLGRNYKKK